MSVSLLSLRRGQCRFAVTPHNALSHLFCAEPVEHEKSPYCAHHAEICFDRRPAEKRLADAEHMANVRALRRQMTSGALGVPHRLRPPVDAQIVVEEPA